MTYICAPLIVVEIFFSIGEFQRLKFRSGTERNNISEISRWIPWECLKGGDGVEPEPYDHKAVIWTLATMIWSMFHRGDYVFVFNVVKQYAFNLELKAASRLRTHPEFLMDSE